MKSLNSALLVALGYVLVAYVYGRLILSRLVWRLDALLRLFQ